jgi:hypothetical protein
MPDAPEFGHIPIPQIGAVRLIIDGTEMQQVLQGDEGVIMHYLIRLSDDIITRARINIKENKHRRHPPNMTGTLARTIVKRPYKAGKQPGMMVVAGVGLNPSYAYWVHEGNGPQGARIYPKRASHLAFVTSGARPTTPEGWANAKDAGIAIIVPSVWTSRPNPFLRDAVGQVIVAAGIGSALQ